MFGWVTTQYLYCKVYLEDIYVYSQTFHELVKNTENIHQLHGRLQKHEIRLKPPMCNFLNGKVRYFGRLVLADDNSTGVRNLKQKIPASP